MLVLIGARSPIIPSVDFITTQGRLYRFLTWRPKKGVLAALHERGYPVRQGALWSEGPTTWPRAFHFSSPWIGEDGLWSELRT